MSGLYSSTPNYGGRQGDNVQNIKQFVSSGYGAVTWVYKQFQKQRTQDILNNLYLLNV